MFLESLLGWISLSQNLSQNVYTYIRFKIQGMYIRLNLDAICKLQRI